MPVIYGQNMKRGNRHRRLSYIKPVTIAPMVRLKIWSMASAGPTEFTTFEFACEEREAVCGIVYGLAD